MHLRARAAGAIGLIVLVASGFAITPQVAEAASDVVGYVYVNDNTAGINTIGAFEQHSDGSLTPVAGSPFAAGGAGTGTSVVLSEGALQVTTDGRYLLAADAGSSQVSVLRICPDGGLRSVQGSPASSGGIEPVSIAVHDGLGVRRQRGRRRVWKQLLGVQAE